MNHPTATVYSMTHCIFSMSSDLYKQGRKIEWGDLLPIPEKERAKK